MMAVVMAMRDGDEGEGEAGGGDGGGDGEIGGEDHVPLMLAVLEVNKGW